MTNIDKDCVGCLTCYPMSEEEKENLAIAITQRDENSAIDPWCEMCNNDYPLEELKATSCGLLCERCIRAIEGRGEDIYAVEN